jgi:hypothetical protein
VVISSIITVHEPSQKNSLLGLGATQTGQINRCPAVRQLLCLTTPLQVFSGLNLSLRSEFFLFSPIFTATYFVLRLFSAHRSRGSMVSRPIITSNNNNNVLSPNAVGPPLTRRTIKLIGLVRRQPTDSISLPRL